MATERHSSKTHRGFMFETLETPQNDRAKSTFLIDLRKHPRFGTDFPAEAFAESGEHVDVTITNVSLSGLRLEGRRQTVGALLDDLDRGTSESKTSLEVHFSVPTDSDHLDPVKVHCRTVHTRCAEKDTYQIGMKIVTFEEGHAALDEYLTVRGAAGLDRQAVRRDKEQAWIIHASPGVDEGERSTTAGMQEVEQCQEQLPRMPEPTNPETGSDE